MVGEKSLLARSKWIETNMSPSQHPSGIATTLRATFDHRIQVLPGFQALSSFDQRRFTTAMLFEVRGFHAQVQSPGALNTFADHYSLMVQLEGASMLDHQGIQSSAAPGEMLLMDVNHAATLKLQGPFHKAMLVFPRSVIAHMETPRPGLLDAQHHPIDRLLRHAMRELILGTSSAAVNEAMVTAVIGLLRESTAFGRTVTGMRPVSPSPSIRIRRAMRLIENRFPDPNLTAETIASSQGVSRRWLDQLWPGEETVSRALRTRRLTEATLLLQRHPEYSLHQIALACGFPSAGAFRHAFRRHYGCSPSQYRLLYSPRSNPLPPSLPGSPPSRGHRRLPLLHSKQLVTSLWLLWRPPN